MRVYRDPDEVPTGESRAVSIGAFDGVHLGHLAVLRLVAELAAARGLVPMVLTFDRHPAEVVRPELAPRLLTSLDQKLELIDATKNVDECLVLTFDEHRSREPAEQFVEQMLATSLRAEIIVVGADFHFGFRRRGNVALLQQMGAELGFEVLGLGLVASPDGHVAAAGAPPYSSTRVRELVQVGDIEAAAEILDRPHELEGRAARSGSPGWVTVSSRYCMPAPGAYDGAIVVDGVVHEAVIDVPEAGRGEWHLRCDGGPPLNAGDACRVRFEARRADGPDAATQEEGRA